MIVQILLLICCVTEMHCLSVSFMLLFVSLCYMCYRDALPLSVIHVPVCVSVLQCYRDSLPLSVIHVPVCVSVCADITVDLLCYRDALPLSVIHVPVCVSVLHVLQRSTASQCHSCSCLCLICVLRWWKVHAD